MKNISATKGTSRIETFRMAERATSGWSVPVPACGERAMSIPSAAAVSERTHPNNRLTGCKYRRRFFVLARIRAGHARVRAGQETAGHRPDGEHLLRPPG